MADAALSPSATARNPKLRLPATCEPPGEGHSPALKVWVIFGATGHMGRSLVKAVLSHGDRVTAVGRTLENSMAQMTGWHEHCLGLLCDVRVRETVDAVLQRTIAHWGRIDIIANCTGYGVIGACEDQDEHELRSQFETNFFGTLNIIQLSLPYFRAQLSGRYLIFSSTNGTLGVPGLGPYCATKYAVEGLIESMLYEVDAFNIKATLVEPGYVRLDEPDSGRTIGPADLDAHSTNTGIDQTRLPRYGHFFVKAPSPTYAGPNAPAGHAKRVVQWLNDRQPTSAVKSAELVWQLGHCSYPPLRLLLGSYAVESIRDRLRSIIEEIEDWKHLSFPVTAEQEEAEKLAEELQAADEQAGELQDERDGLGTGDAKDEGEMQRVLEEREGQESERSGALEQNQQQQPPPMDGNGATLDRSIQLSP